MLTKSLAAMRIKHLLKVLAGVIPVAALTTFCVWGVLSAFDDLGKPDGKRFIVAGVFHEKVLVGGETTGRSFLQ